MNSNKCRTGGGTVSLRWEQIVTSKWYKLNVVLGRIGWKKKVLPSKRKIRNLETQDGLQLINKCGVSRHRTARCIEVRSRGTRVKVTLAARPLLMQLARKAVQVRTWHSHNPNVCWFSNITFNWWKYRLSQYTDWWHREHGVFVYGKCSSIDRTAEIAAVPVSSSSSAAIAGCSCKNSVQYTHVIPQVWGDSFSTRVISEDQHLPGFPPWGTWSYQQ